MKKTLLLSIFFTALNLEAQSTEEDFRYLNKTDRITIENRKGKVGVTTSIYERAKFLSPNKLYLANKSIPYDRFRKIEDLEAATILDNGQKKNVSLFETKDELGGMVFYSDNKTKEFHFPNVKEGTEIEHSYKEVHSGEIPFSYIFQFASYFPTSYAELTVEFPNDVEIDFKLFNAEELEIGFNEKKGKKTTVYSWKVAGVEGIKVDNSNDSDYESRLYYLPHIVVYLKSYIDHRGERVTVLNEVKDLYNWYTQLIQNRNDDDNTEVLRLAEKLTEGIENESDKARILYQWVQKNISYVAFGDGFGGFVPRDARSVCEKKYGDCKDMSHLLYVMLNHVGVKAYRAWVGSRRKPYRYVENPTPFIDDHMITMAIIEGDSVFLDGTDGFIEFGYPSSFTQGKEALVGVDESTFFIREVPVVPSTKNIINVNTTASLQDGKVVLAENRTLNGMEKAEFIMNYLREKEEVLDEEFLNQELKLGNNKTRYSNIVLAGLDNESNQLKLAYDLQMEDYYREIGGRIFINMNFDRALSKEMVDIKTRIYDKKIDNTFQRIYSTILEIPDGFSLQEVPEEVSYPGKNYGFEIVYREVEGGIEQTKKIYLNTLQITPDEFPEWNEFVQKLVSAYRKNLVLISKN